MHADLEHRALGVARHPRQGQGHADMVVVRLDRGMRQAGRYLPQYRALREKYSLLELCRQPDLAVTVTLQPLDVIDLDAAILFSDLLLPFEPMGLAFDFVKGEGPAIENPVRSAADLDRLHTFEPDALGHVLETIRILRRELNERVPLIGFGGAPFTLAAYAIEGGPSRDYLRTKSFMAHRCRRSHSARDRQGTEVRFLQPPCRHLHDQHRAW